MSGRIRRKAVFKKEWENLVLPCAFCLLFAPCSWEHFEEYLIKSKLDIKMKIQLLLTWKVNITCKPKSIFKKKKRMLNWNEIVWKVFATSVDGSFTLVHLVKIFSNLASKHSACFCTGCSLLCHGLGWFQDLNTLGRRRIGISRFVYVWDLRKDTWA